MNLEKYDSVLMDIVMPKLDGVSTTSLIPQFDHMTPIISMTSNSKPNEIMTYYHSGMNDILPKPFIKEGLLEMLETFDSPQGDPAKVDAHLVLGWDPTALGHVARPGIDREP
ncbi:hypothetical protein EW146_g10404 [Bondarzewia mesenterica]|uniref:Response regulatory domain-containing protein n=1 Tax=Bondarzewia mesenterica TaxID=1095465 RepID=A0A4S4KYM9_9AGAM|nr:hypothetical protein EW146_g10404 [Bondarzewia mesenterica]